MTTESTAAIFKGEAGATLRRGLAGLGLALMVGASSAHAADVDFEDLNLNQTAEQRPAVDGINAKVSAVTGVIGGYANHMFIASVATGIPYFSQFGAQVDLGIGNYRQDYNSAAAGLHLFWRDPSIGMLGIYGDWGYVNPEHLGRLGTEMSWYNGAWSVDVFAGVQLGQHVLTEFVDEVDLSYYFTDNFRASIGHRLISRGHVGNIGFEFMPALGGMKGWSVYGEAEAGEDEYYGAWVGVRYAFGSSSASTLIERDRYADPKVRIPRNLASATRCGDIQDPNRYHKSWNGFATNYTQNLCGSADDLADYGAIEAKQ